MQIVLAKGLIQIIIYQRLVQLFVELSKKGDQCEGTTILTWESPDGVWMSVESERSSQWATILSPRSFIPRANLIGDNPIPLIEESF